MTNFAVIEILGINTTSSQLRQPTSAVTSGGYGCEKSMKLREVPTGRKIEVESNE